MSKTSMEAIIKESKVFQEISSKNDDVEIWNDAYVEDGWAYWNIVSNYSGIVRRLAYLRIKGDKIQRRTYDDNGDDLWVLL